MAQRSRRQSRSRQQSRSQSQRRTRSQRRSQSQRRTRTQRRSQSQRRTRSQRRSQSQRRTRSQRGGFWGGSSPQPQFIRTQIGGGGWGGKIKPTKPVKKPGKKTFIKDPEVMRFLTRYF